MSADFKAPASSPPPAAHASLPAAAATAVATGAAAVVPPSPTALLSPTSVVLTKQLKPNTAAPGVVAERIGTPVLDEVQPKKTKIVATLGPASNTQPVLERLITAGVDVFRLNFSHGKYEEHAATAAAIRAAAKQVGRAVAILADLQGPKFRTGLIDAPTKKVNLKKGDAVSVATTTKRPGAPGTRACLTSGTAHADVMVREVQVGHRIMINDGAVVLRVTGRVDADEVRCTVLVGGDVGEKKGMNVPELKVPIPAITEKDAKDAVFALGLGVDFMALSFVQRPDDVTQLKELLEQHLTADPANPRRVPRIPKICSKIEKPQAIECIDEILAVTDVLMVARGDLGVECSLESVPVYQKLLIEKCNKALVPVITATQMLESMITNASPTRAEVSDVANAVYDGTDAVMLSGESAMGAYPVEAVQMMASIVENAERAIRQKALAPIVAAAASGGSASAAAHGHGHGHGHPHMQMNVSFPSVDFMHHAMALSAHVAAQGLQARAIVAVCLTYDMACYVSKLRSLCPIVAVTPSPRLFRCFQLSYGLIPVLLSDTDRASGAAKKPDATSSSDHFIVDMEQALQQVASGAPTVAAGRDVLRGGDLYIFVSGASPVPGLTHSMQALRFGEAAKQMASKPATAAAPAKAAAVATTAATATAAAK